MKNQSEDFDDDEIERFQDVLDRLVACARKGGTQKSDDIQILIEKWDDIFSRTEYITNSIDLASIECRLNDNDLADHLGVESDQITDNNRIDYARDLIVSQTSDFDADFSPAYRGGVIQSSSGVEALVVYSVTGYSFSGIDISFEGVFSSEEYFRETTRSKNRYLTDEIRSPEETKKYITDEDILEAWDL